MEIHIFFNWRSVLHDVYRAYSLVFIQKSEVLFAIPHAVTNLDLGPREGSRDSAIANGSILEKMDPFAIVESRGFGAVQIPSL